MVGASGSILNHRQGRFIDGHDVVIRPSWLRTAGYEPFVCRRTRINLFFALEAMVTQFEAPGEARPHPDPHPDPGPNPDPSPNPSPNPNPNTNTSDQAKLPTAERAIGLATCSSQRAISSYF